MCWWWLERGVGRVDVLGMLSGVSPSFIGSCKIT